MWTANCIPIHLLIYHLFITSGGYYSKVIEKHGFFINKYPSQSTFKRSHLFWFQYYWLSATSRHTHGKGGDPSWPEQRANQTWPSQPKARKLKREEIMIPELPLGPNDNNFKWPLARPHIHKVLRKLFWEKILPFELEGGCSRIQNYGTTH